jgi:hypothetical protein
MATLAEEIEEASRGRKVPLDRPDFDKESLKKARIADTEKRFDRVNADRNEDPSEIAGETADDLSPSESPLKNMAKTKETRSDKITPHPS